ncbi:hypothetical protein [Streptomyces yangpuensis]|uniref:hypothetical protein n=1 Tax=Streptomyces yangpuensis TaxID=1648182 RepID=UPI003806B0E9
MNGNLMIHPTALGVTAPVLFLPAMTLPTGQTPSNLRSGAGHAQAHGWAVLACLAAVLNAVLRLVEAPSSIVLAGTGPVALCALAAGALLLLAALARRQPGGEY